MAVKGSARRASAHHRRESGADPSVWRAQFLREVMDDPDLQRAVVDKVLTDMFDDLRHSRHRVIRPM